MKGGPELIQAFLDEELSRNDERHLAEWLNADVENLRYFVRETHLHRQLRDLLLSERSLAESATREPGQPGRIRVGMAWLDQARAWLGNNLAPASAIALVLALLGITAWWTPQLGRDKGGPEIGRVLTVVGMPSVQGSGRARAELAASSAVRFGDRIETGDADRLEIKFNDGTTLQLYFNTVVQIPRPAGDRKAAARFTRPPEIELLQGQVWTVVQKSTNGTPYAIRTDAATALARGTEFGVKVDRPLQFQSTSAGNGERTNATVMTVKEGTVEFFNAFGSVQATAMTESTARFGSAPTEPKRLQTLQRVNATTGNTMELITLPLSPRDAGGKAVGRVPSVDLSSPGGNTNDLAPSLSAEERAALAVWVTSVAQASTNSTSEKELLGAALRISPSAGLQAAACNDLGVLFELQDSLGAAIRAYGRAVQLAPDVALYRHNLGQALRMIGSFERALEEFEAAARLAPGSAHVRSSHAELFSLLGQNSEAFVRLDSLLAAFPDHHRGWEIKAQLLVQENRPEEALEAARKAAELDPSCEVGLSYLARAFLLTGNMSEAERAYRQALVIAPRNPLLHMNLGRVHEARSEVARAEEAYRRAVELDPQRTVLWGALAEFLGRQQRWPEAEATLRQALHSAGEDAEIQRDLAAATVKLGRTSAAENLYQKLLEADPEDAAAFFGLGQVKIEQGRYAEAEQWLGKAVQSEPENPAGYEALANLYIHGFRQPERAEQLYRRAIELAPARAFAYVGLSSLYHTLRTPAEAETIVRAGLEQNAASPELHNSLGEALRLQGRLDEAVVAYRQALHLAPHNTSPVNNLAIIHGVRGEFREAEEMFRQLLTRAAQDPSINPLKFLQNLAIVCKEQGKMDEAHAYLEQALVRAPDNPDVHNIFAWFLADTCRDLDRALVLARRAVAEEPNNAGWLGTLGFVHLQRDELDEAEKVLERALQISRGNSEDIQKTMEKVRQKRASRVD